jgi:hypothetical protein
MRLIVVCAALAMLTARPVAEAAAPPEPSRTECLSALEAYKTGKRNPERWTVSQCLVKGLLTADEIRD